MSTWRTRIPPSYLTRSTSTANIQGMAHSFLIFEFGGDEETAQQARHRVEGWKQGFRLDKKLQVKFERQEPEARPAKKSEAPAAAKPKSTKSAAKGKSKPEAKAKVSDKAGSKSEVTEASNDSKIRLIVRLDFSDHEKLSHQRWLERIPTEEPFKSANPKIVRAGEPEFKAISELFDSLD